MATGRARGSPVAPSLVAEGRRLLVKSLCSWGVQGELPDHPRPGQCFLIEALGELLRILGDPDWRIFASRRHSFATGVPLGLEGLPRTPAVFERKRRWRKYEEFEGLGGDVKENYVSARLHADEIQKQFEQEALEGADEGRGRGHG